MRQQDEQRVACKPGREERCGCYVRVPAYDGEACVEGHGHKEQQERSQRDELRCLFGPCRILFLQNSMSIKEIPCAATGRPVASHASIIP